MTADPSRMAEIAERFLDRMTRDADPIMQARVSALRERLAHTDAGRPT